MSEASVPRRIALALAVAALALLGLAGNASAATLATFGFTGSAQTFTVPAGVHHLSIQALGAQGGHGGIGEFDMQGGLGGQANAPLSVTPGEVLYIYVGGSGGYGGAPSGGGIITAGAGGFNGGGPGGQANTACDFDTCENGYGAGGGGGATDVRQGGSGLGNRVIVAGGGAGGAADCTDGGGGGGTTGDSSCGAGAGTQSAGGAGGSGAGGGSLGSGGTGAAGILSGNYEGLDGGSGGGGGFYGGGGGGPGSTGGGGSGYAPGGTMANGVQSGSGSVTISSVSVSAQADSPAVAVGHEVPITATVTGGFAPTGDVTFRIYGPGDPDCSDFPSHMGGGSVSGTTATSEFTPTQLGDYVVLALYDGDSDNDSGLSPCSDPNAVVHIVPNMPTGLASSPPSPANSNAPRISGAADPGSTVNVYASPDCSGSPVATGNAAAFGASGLTAHVPDNSTTTFSATAGASSETSACSTDTLVYVEDSVVPEATIESNPRASSNVNSATFTYSSSEQNSTFECNLDSAGYVPCPPSGQSYTALSNGDHTFSVRASDAAGNTGSADSFTWNVNTIDTANFDYTGSAQTFTVPGDVSRITIDSLGAQGGMAGGNGGEATATIAVTPGEELQVNVGGQGGTPDPGFNGGGTGGSGDDTTGGGGGGASDVRQGGTDLTDRVVIAGGGGGGTGCDGGAGGGTTGGPGVACVQNNYSVAGGGGTQSSGGAGGNANPGTLGTGGDAGQNTSGYIDFGAGGGGGGGYYGGGGGTGSDFLHVAGNGSGGGGGSGFTPDGTGMTNDVKAGNGRVTIIFRDSLSSQATSTVLGGLIHDTATLADGASPTGDITFNAYEPGDTDCSGPAVFSETKTVSGNGPYRSSDFTPETSGTYLWTLDYSGDENNPASSSACGSSGDTSTVSAAPTALAVSPSSPGNNNTPRILGTAEAGSTVNVYASADCSGSPVATGTAAAFSSPGLQVHVPDNSTTTFHATWTDGSAQTTPCSFDSIAYAEDSIIPESTIDTKPPQFSNMATASFTYSSTEQGSTFECARDSGAFAACSPNGTNYSGLAEGSHTFSVRASDAAGNTGSADTYTWTVNTVTPTVSITSTPPSSTSSSSATFAYTSSQDVTFTCRLDSGSASPCPAGGRTYSGLSFSPHTFTVTATNDAGSSASASYSWSVVQMAPALTLVKGTRTISGKGIADVATLACADGSCALASANATVKISGSSYPASVSVAPTVVSSDQTGSVSIKLSKGAKAALRKARRGTASLKLTAASSNGMTSRLSGGTKVRAAG